MSFRTKRTNSRRNRMKPEKREQTYLISLGEGNCNCPICQAMGVDLDASKGVDVRQIEDPAELERILALLEEVKGMETN